MPHTTTLSSSGDTPGARRSSTTHLNTTRHHITAHLRALWDTSSRHKKTASQNRCPKLQRGGTGYLTFHHPPWTVHKIIVIRASGSRQTVLQSSAHSRCGQATRGRAGWAQGETLATNTKVTRLAHNCMWPAGRTWGCGRRGACRIPPHHPVKAIRPVRGALTPHTSTHKAWPPPAHPTTMFPHSSHSSDSIQG
jgi:hypothetical protein